MKPDTRDIAARLVELSLGEHTFEALVKQVVAQHRQIMNMRLMTDGRSQPSAVAERLAAADEQYPQFERKLNAHYPQYAEAMTDFYLDRLSEEEMREHIATLEQENVQRYLHMSRSLQEEMSFVVGQLISGISRRAWDEGEGA